MRVLLRLQVGRRIRLDDPRQSQRPPQSAKRPASHQLAEEHNGREQPTAPNPSVMLRCDPGVSRRAEPAGVMLRLMRLRAAWVVLIPLLVSCGSSDAGRAASVDDPAQPPSASAATPTPPASDRKYVPGIWAVQNVSADRASVTARAYGIAGGCSGPGRGTVVETPDGLRVQIEIEVPADDGTPCFASLPMVPVTVGLPRPLQPGEQLRGECVPEDGTTEGQQCEIVRRFASLPPPTGG